MKRFWLITLAILAAGIAAHAQGAASAVQAKAAALDAPGGLLESSNWGFKAFKLADTQKNLVSLNAKKRLVPASNMKLVSTGAALLAFGPEYRFETRFAHSGEIKDSVLCGDLYIIGGGDPLIGELFPYLPGREFSAWQKVLDDAGIRRIEGDIVGDGSYFKGEPRHGDWSMEDHRTKDGVVPRGLTWRGRMEDSVPDGPYAAALYFAEWLGGANGHIQVCGNAMSGSLPDNLLHQIGTVRSAPLREIASVANHWSDNFCAETLVKALGLKYRGSDEYGAATTALHDALAPLGLKDRSYGMRFADGSGLSRKNYISPEFMADFLAAMARSRVWKDYLASLPRPGMKDGTLTARLKDCPDKSRIFMKSGSMNGVRCYSGYILSGNGRKEDTIVFSLMVNNYVGNNSRLNTSLDALIAALAEINR